MTFLEQQFLSPDLIIIRLFFMDSKGLVYQSLSPSHHRELAPVAACIGDLEYILTILRRESGVAAYFLISWSKTGVSDLSYVLSICAQNCRNIIPRTVLLRCTLSPTFICRTLEIIESSFYEASVSVGGKCSIEGLYNGLYETYCSREVLSGTNFSPQS